MTKQTKSVLNSNIDFIQLKLYDFSDEKIDHEKLISERLNKNPKIENTNQKLFLDENNTFKYDNPICPVCGSHKIIKKGTITKKTKYQWKNHRIPRTAISMQKMQQKIWNK
jgi:hypothetical protein